MFNKTKFRAAVLLSGKTLSEVAELLGINLATLYRKMNGESDFYRNEIQILCKELKISNPVEIFFAAEIA